MKKADKYLIIGILGLAFCLLIGIQFFIKKEGKEIVIEKEGEVFLEASLEEDQQIVIEDGEGVQKNILEIKDGYAKMIDSNCPDHLCEKQKKIGQRGETIICLPNEVVVEVRGGEEREIDSIAR